MSLLPFPLDPTPRATRTRHGRFYEVPQPDGAVLAYPSVTTVLEVVAKPALVGWAARTERTHVSATAADLYHQTAKHAQFPRASFILALEQRLGRALAHVAASDAALAIGSELHAAIEATLRRGSGPAPTLSAPATLAFRTWQLFARETQLTPLRVEQVVISHAHRYAGTLDLVATLDAANLLRYLQRQGAVAPALVEWLAARTTVTALIDWKTSKAVYREALLQSVAYQRALKEMGLGRVDGGLVVRLPKDPADRRGLEVAVVPSARDLFPTFLAARQLWEWSAAPEVARRLARRA
jgi:hypothetical protein